MKTASSEKPADVMEGATGDHTEDGLRADNAPVEREAADDRGAAQPQRGDPSPGIMSIEEHPVPFFTLVRIRIVRAFLRVWMRVFSLSGLYLLGYAFGIGEYLVDYRRRRRVHDKLKAYFKERATPQFRRKACIGYFTRMRCDKIFYTILDRIPRDQIMNRIELSGVQHVKDGHEKGNGVYVALCHFGSHHIAGLLMALLGFELAGVRDGKESAVRRYIQNRYVETFPEIRRMKMFAANSFPRGIYRHLQDNKIVASLLDPERRRGQTTKTMTISMFGTDRDVLIGPLQIAMRCNSEVLQGFVISKPYFHYELRISPPLVENYDSKDEDRTIRRILGCYAGGVESFAENHPDHLMNI